MTSTSTTNYLWYLWYCFNCSKYPELCALVHHVYHSPNALTQSSTEQKKTFQHEIWVFSATWHACQISTVLHRVVCCGVWWAYFLWKYSGCWNVMLARTDQIVYHHGSWLILCRGDSRTNILHFYSPMFSSLTAHTATGWSFFLLKITLEMAPFFNCSLLDIVLAHCKSTWVTLTKFLGCLGCISDQEM